jgi:hypothetical protein
MSPETAGPQPARGNDAGEPPKSECPASISGVCLHLTTNEQYICDTSDGECVADGILGRSEQAG